MPGPLPEIDAIIEAPLLDVDRGLTMGRNVVLELYVPDQEAEAGLRLIRQYTHAFNRIAEDEQEIGDGRTVVFRISNVFPAGQLDADLAQKDLYIRWGTTGQMSEFCKVNEVPRPADNVGQIYTVTAKTRTFKQTFFGR